MGRAALVVFFAVCISIGALGSTGRAPGQARARPSLWLVSDSPVKLRGAGFRPHEHVKLVVVAGRRLIKRFVAGARGGFVVRMPGIDANACTRFSALATGDRGSRASFKRAPGRCAIP